MDFKEYKAKEKTYSDGIIIEYTTLSECRVMFDYGILTSPLEGLEEYAEFLSKNGDGSISIDCSYIDEGLVVLRQNLAKNLRDESDIAIALCTVKQDQTLDTDVNSRTFLQVLKDSVEARLP